MENTKTNKKYMNLIKKILPFRFKRKVKENLGVPSLHWSLENLKKKNFFPAHVIDIGAYEGHWTLDLLEVYPHAKVFMVEAQKSKSGYLEKVKQQYTNTDYSISLLSSVDGVQKYFYENETASHVGNVTANNGNSSIMNATTLDSLLKERKFPFPDLLKLDVQGHEIEVLKGAAEALFHATICLLEVSLLDLGDGNPLLKEVLNFMDEKGFQAYDISHFIRRPFDKSLYQMDMFFVKKDSFLIAEKRWD